ncbi:hypothetical protein INS49_012419 [Diaporthe citri]|uniref:uncharacterized protein n=1 Tax=Diaporthe citri TaxID=83186 RepID=UPI001C7E7ABA|nr:uncharacterized protein INS49_012419 [Diaporthe citri]KAG6358899.1 hypothetical protein INS49_012419 [Diaporthe citri]
MTQFDWSWPEEILNGPACPSPDGNYNFDFRPPHNVAAYVLITICAALTAVAASLRAYSRLRVTKRVYLEDYLALFSLAPYICFLWALISYIRGGGLYVHQWNIRAGNMLDLAVYLMFFSIIDPVYVIPAKAAILWEWKRIFVPRGTRNTFYWTTWFLISLNSLFYFVGTFFIIFANNPVQKSWNVLLPGSTPFSRKDLDVVATGINLAVDVTIFMLPQRVIWTLQMAKSRKIGLSFMFSLGLLSLACASGRLYATAKTIYPWPTIGDTSYTISDLWLWYLAEITSVNLVMSAPSVPRAFAEHTFLGRLLASIKTWSSVWSSKSRSAISKTWPRTIGNLPINNGHRLGDEDTRPMGLADLELMQAAKKGGTFTTTTDSSNPATIMRTIEVDQEQESISRSSDPNRQRQHPWMDV